ncbi:MAG: hypothetical protein R3B84_24660 [Zavarzinella sp.]
MMLLSETNHVLASAELRNHPTWGKKKLKSVPDPVPQWTTMRITSLSGVRCK